MDMSDYLQMDTIHAAALHCLDIGSLCYNGANDD